MKAGVELTWFTTAQLPGHARRIWIWHLFGHAAAFRRRRPAGGGLHSTRWLWPLAFVLMATVTMHFFWKDPGLWTNWKLVVFWRTLLAATCALAVVSVCAINDAWFLGLTAPLRYLGKISYGIYLWHLLVITAIKPMFAHDPAQACLWTVGLTLLMASLSWHFFEKPLMERYGKSSDDSKRTPQTSSRLRTFLISALAKRLRTGGPA